MKITINFQQLKPVIESKVKLIKNINNYYESMPLDLYMQRANDIIKNKYKKLEPINKYDPKDLFRVDYEQVKDYI